VIQAGSEHSCATQRRHPVTVVSELACVSRSGQNADWPYGHEIQSTYNEKTMKHLLFGLLGSIAIALPAIAALEAGDTAPAFEAKASLAGKSFDYSWWSIFIRRHTHKAAIFRHTSLP